MSDNGAHGITFPPLFLRSITLSSGLNLNNIEYFLILGLTYCFISILDNREEKVKFKYFYLAPDHMGMFLRTVMKKLRQGMFDPPRTFIWPPTVYYLPRNYRGQPYNLPLIELETRGCSWSIESGGCTMCNYGGQGRDLPSEILVAQASFALSIVRGSPYIHLVPIGSFYDEREVPEDVRRKITEIVRDSGFVEYMGTESRAGFVTEEKISETVDILENIQFEVGVGLESSDDIIRELIVNKGESKASFLRFYRICKEKGVVSATHVLLKPPFLTESEAIEDAVKSIRWSIDNGSDYVILMVMNLRKGYTLTNWLYERGKYKLPMLWSLIKVLLDLGEGYSKKVVIGGLISSETMAISAKNCEKCTDRILSLLSMYQYTWDPDYLEEAWEYPCDCKERWEELMEMRDVDLPDRILRYYEEIALELFGRDWWNENKGWVEREVYEFERVG
jgi:radical SAM enzyme (TIGR01210 family)